MKESMQNIVNNAWTSMEDSRVPTTIWPEVNVARAKLMLGLNRGNYDSALEFTVQCSIRTLTSKWDRPNRTIEECVTRKMKQKQMAVIEKCMINIFGDTTLPSLSATVVEGIMTLCRCLSRHKGEGIDLLSITLIDLETLFDSIYASPSVCPRILLIKFPWFKCYKRHISHSIFSKSCT